MLIYYPSWYIAFQATFISFLALRYMGAETMQPQDALLAAGFAFMSWLVVFILQGIGLYKMAKNAKVANAWLAFMPFAHILLVGKLAGDVSFFGHKVRRWGLYTMIADIVIAVYYVFLAIAMYVLFVQNGESMEIYNEYYVKWSNLPPSAIGWERFYNLSQYYFGSIVALIHTLLTFILFLGFYKRYSYRHFILLALLGNVIPFFNGITIFTMRNREPVDYEAILRARQAAFKAAQQNNTWQNGYGGTYGNSYGNPYGNPYGSTYSNPYGSTKTSAQESKTAKPEDPFGEFSDGNSSSNSSSGSSGGNTDGFFS